MLNEVPVSLGAGSVIGLYKLLQKIGSAVERRPPEVGGIFRGEFQE